jgi:prophage antirepressor-like protein
LSTNLPAFSSPAPLNLNFEGRRVRFVGTAEVPEWIAQDACDAVGIVSAASALRDFDEDQKGMRSLHTIAGKQNLLTVYESGLYRLIFQSRKPEGKRFQKWVFDKVLPSIRKYGVYPPPQDVSQITLKPYTARIVWAPQVRQQLPKGYWCVFLEGAEIMIGAEQIFGPANLEMHQYDLIDGSIGKHWPPFRQDKPWMGRRVKYNYTYPNNDPRGTVQPWAYPMQELPHFKDWLHDTYMSTHFPKYVRNKYGDVAFQTALPIFAKLGIPLASPR